MSMEIAEFKDLAIGDLFDFISGNYTTDSFYDDCEKISARKYISIQSRIEYTVGSIHVKCYHVERRT